MFLFKQYFSIKCSYVHRKPVGVTIKSSVLSDYHLGGKNAVIKIKWNKKNRGKKNKTWFKHLKTVPPVAH